MCSFFVQCYESSALCEFSFVIEIEKIAHDKIMKTQKKHYKYKLYLFIMFFFVFS